jgi:hypothetical protein
VLHDHSPEYWARQASLDDLAHEVQHLGTWNERAAEVLDFAYLERSLRVLGRTTPAARDEALALADHLTSVAHDQDRAALERLGRPYFARWRVLADLLHRNAMRLEVPRSVLGRKHVEAILRAVSAAGGRLAQGKLDDIIRNEGQRSATLKLMEQWDLIERTPGGAGNTRTVAITELGRMAITDRAAAAAAATAATATMPRPCTLMYAPRAAS